LPAGLLFGRHFSLFWFFLFLLLLLRTRPTGGARPLQQAQKEVGKGKKANGGLERSDRK